MIVIDIGCAQYGGDMSIPHLIEEFHPDILYGFDPHSSIEEGVSEYVTDPGGGGWLTEVVLECKAAWIYDGEIAFTEAGLGSTVGKGKQKVPCFDLARFIKELPGEGHVLKMDAEEAEYTILPHLVEQDADLLLSLALIEFHPNWVGDERRAPVEAAMRCEVREWLH